MKGAAGFNPALWRADLPDGQPPCSSLFLPVSPC